MEFNSNTKISGWADVGVAILAWLAVPGDRVAELDVRHRMGGCQPGRDALGDGLIRESHAQLLQALALIASSLVTECANISVFLVLPAVLLAYLLSIGLAVERLFIAEIERLNSGSRSSAGSPDTQFQGFRCDDHP